MVQEGLRSDVATATKITLVRLLMLKTIRKCMGNRSFLYYMWVRAPPPGHVQNAHILFISIENHIRWRCVIANVDTVIYRFSAKTQRTQSKRKQAARRWTGCFRNLKICVLTMRGWWIQDTGYAHKFYHQKRCVVNSECHLYLIYIYDNEKEACRSL